MKSPYVYTLIAAGWAFAGSAASIHLSVGLDLTPCPLCYYQRTLVMGAFAILSAGLLVDRRRTGVVCILALPLALSGLLIAGYHTFLIFNGTLDCPAGLFGIGSAPLQSFLMFLLLTAAVAAGAWLGREPLFARGVIVFPGVLLLAVLLTWGSVTSAKPPGPAERDSAGKLKGCGLK